MASVPRLILLFAATTGIAALLSTVAPAAAAESTLTMRETTAKAAPSTTRHRASRVRIAASNYHRRIDFIRSDLGCSGIWCGRQFVLIVGIGY